MLAKIVTPVNSFSLVIIQINEFVTVDGVTGSRLHSDCSVVGILNDDFGLGY